MMQQNIRSDREIHQGVLDMLRTDIRVEATEVGVEVDKGVVTLTGTVSSNIKKLAAQEVAHRVDSVLDVANEIRVRALGALGLGDGAVSLRGRVRSQREKRAVLGAVGYAPNVREIRDFLQVDPSS